MRIFTWSVLALAASMCFASERGEVHIPSAAEAATLCDDAIAKYTAGAAAIEQLPLAQASVKTVLMPWDKVSGDFSDFASTAFLLQSAHPDAKVREAEEACSLKISDITNKVQQSEPLYQRLKAVKPADAIDAETLKSILDAFEDTGVNLPAPKRKQLIALLARSDKLQQDFERNVRDSATKLAFTEAQLKGLPDDLMKRLPRDAAGKVLIGFDYPEYLPALENVEDGDVRHQLYVGFNRRGGPANLAILTELAHVRKQMATVMGFPSYAAWATRTRMVGNPKVALDFLAKVRTAVDAGEKKDIAVLTEEKRKVTGDAKAKLERWDVSFYESRVKKAHFNLDQQEVRTQFPTDASVAWMMAVTSKMYGVEFRPNPKLPVWHEDVKGYDIYDLKSGEYLSTFYMDLFPRDGKYKHAAAFPMRAVGMLEGRTAVAALETNLARNGLDQEELVTLFHEFGHVMHGTLSRTRYTSVAGTGVKLDFVEAPSQMYEAWPTDPSAAALWNETCPSCKPIDLELIKRMKAAKQFDQGIFYARQWLYASYDMNLFSAIPKDPLALWVKMEGATPLGHVPDSMLPASFDHLLNYGAGYYSYMWSEVLALDMRTPYGDKLLNPEIGMRFRKTVLENGGQVPPMQLVREFLGREPNSDAFFREITGQAAGAGAK